MSVAAARTYASLEEVYELVRLAHERDRPGVRFYPQVGNHCADLYAELVKRDVVERRGRGGFHRWTYTQMARQLYDDVESLHEGGKAKTNSLRRWLDRLKAAGLVEWQGSHGHWVEVRLLEVPDVATMLDPSARSSAGSSYGECEVRRRRESARERRQNSHQRWRRRTGQKGVGRVVATRAACPASSADERFGSSRARPPYGGNEQEKDQTHGHVRDGLTGVDAIRLACPPSRRAALEKLLAVLTGHSPAEGRASTEEAPGILVAAGRDGSPAVAVALAAWAVRCPEVEPRLSKRNAERLERAAAQLDRLQGPGAAAAAIVANFRTIKDGFDLTTGAQIGTVAYVAAGVRAEARAAVRYDRWRRGRRATPTTRPWKSRRGDGTAC